MSKVTIYNIAITICLLLVQVLIFNHIMLFNVAMAFVFIYPILRLRIDLKMDWLLTWAFLSGLIVDLFSDTPGVNALSCTLLAAAKRPALFAYVLRDDRTKSIVPSIRELGISAYSKYLLTMSALYCVLAFSIEYFNFADIKEIAIMSASSTLFTFAMLLGLECIFYKK